MDTASGNNNNSQNKRVRFANETDSEDAGNNNRPTPSGPKARADATLNSFLATLSPSLKTLAKLHAEEILKILMELQRHDDTIRRNTKVDYLPNSARVKFNLTPSARVKGLQLKDADFKTRCENRISQAELTVSTFTSSAKMDVVEQVKLEIFAAKEELVERFTIAVGQLSLVLLKRILTIEDRTSDEAHLNNMAFKIACFAIEQQPRLIEFSGIPKTNNDEFDLPKFYALFKKHSQIAQEKEAYVHGESGTVNDATKQELSAYANQFKHLIDNALKKPWKEYYRVHYNNEREKEAKQLADTFVAERATQRAAEALETEAENMVVDGEDANNATVVKVCDQRFKHLLETNNLVAKKTKGPKPGKGKRGAGNNNKNGTPPKNKNKKGGAGGQGSGTNGGKGNSNNKKKKKNNNNSKKNGGKSKRK
jgi:hypothetical protein